MTIVKWEKGGKGLQYYSHETRKFGIKFDRCFRGRYKLNGKETVIPFGWGKRMGGRGKGQEKGHR